MSETYFCNNESTFGTESSKIFEITESKEIEELKSKNEKLEQENYDLRRKLENNEKLLKEAMEMEEYSSQHTIEELQDSIEKIKEKFNAEKKLFNEQMSEMQNELSSKEDEIEKQKELLKELQSKFERQIKFQQKKPVPEIFYSVNEAQDSSQIENLMNLLETETHEYNQLKEAHSLVCQEMENLREISNVTKRNSEEKTDIIESLREELAMCQSELNALKSAPTNVGNKGNSIFAELEDSRNRAIQEKKAIQNEFVNLKRIYALKDAEMERMKLEKATLVRTLEEDAMKIMSLDKELENTNEDTILHLQKQLKIVRSQLDKALDDELQKSNISFLEIQLIEQKKEVNKLRSEIDNDYIAKCVEQEKMKKLLNEVRLWKYRALTNENTNGPEESKETQNLNEKRKVDAKEVYPAGSEKSSILPAKKVKFCVESADEKKSDETQNVVSCQSGSLPRKVVKKSHPTIFISSVTE